MITELQQEKDRLDQAIEALERLSAGKAKRRGRPPNWLREHLGGPSPEDASGADEYSSVSDEGDPATPPKSHRSNGSEPR